MPDAAASAFEWCRSDNCTIFCVLRCTMFCVLRANMIRPFKLAALITLPTYQHAFLSQACALPLVSVTSAHVSGLHTSCMTYLIEHVCTPATTCMRTNCTCGTPVGVHVCNMSLLASCHTCCGSCPPGTGRSLQWMLSATGDCLKGGAQCG